jgi:hypothetical protein
MDSVGRLLLRVILIPVGYVMAVIAGTLVILFGSWKIGQPVMTEVEGHPVVLYGFVFAAPILLVTLLSVMWLPAAVGILIAEAFAIRSWIFHAANGALSAYVVWSNFGYVDGTRIALNGPLAVVAAGLAGGFTYWAIAGWSSGFLRPVFRKREAPPFPSHPASQPPQIR